MLSESKVNKILLKCWIPKDDFRDKDFAGDEVDIRVIDFAII